MPRSAAPADRGRPAGRGRRAAARRRHATGVLFTLPALLAVAAIVGYPMVYSLNLSFRSFDLLRPDSQEGYVGLENYRELADSSEFVNALFLTVAFVVTTLVLEIVVGLAIALLINQNLRGMSVFRLIVTLPLMMAPSVAGLQFRFLFADDYGAIDAILQRVGVTAPLWFVDANFARIAILLSNLWLATPFVVLVFLAAMSNLPKDPFEAARIDGAGSFQILRYILLPMLRPALLIIIVIRMADAFRMFDLVYNLTGGGPGRSTDVLTNFIYRQTFVRADFAGGAAASFVLVVLVAVLSFVAFRLLRTREDS
ncbi:MULTISPECIES: carbohydrate ABC transporter permease [unclassified Nocardioides]|uniref:carbohydrate ABC transporter permease n=1 Tax=unclassified Nocardioides TaxID=2615069 RepID=UPI000A267B88|nr:MULTISPECIES: sugar ABC transporter permease [unclassified Nocardioides]